MTIALLRLAASIAAVALVVLLVHAATAHLATVTLVVP
jgi:hypothetical protein